MKNRLKKILNLDHCHSNFEEKVLALAEGIISSEDERADIFSHLLECASCRLLYEDFFLAHENFDETELVDRGVEGIEIALLDEGFIPVSGNYSTAVAAQVLSGNKTVGTLEYSIHLNNREISVRLISSGGIVSVELEPVISNETYYLIGKDDCRIARSRRGTVSFDKLVGGRYVISENLKDFISIKINKNK